MNLGKISGHQEAIIPTSNQNQIKKVDRQRETNQANTVLKSHQPPQTKPKSLNEKNINFLKKKSQDTDTETDSDWNAMLRFAHTFKCTRNYCQVDFQFA